MGWPKPLCKHGHEIGSITSSCYECALEDQAKEDAKDEDTKAIESTLRSVMDAMFEWVHKNHNSNPTGIYLSGDEYYMLLASTHKHYLSAQVNHQERTFRGVKFYQVRGETDHIAFSI